MVISRDRMGRTVLIDRFGNLVATEIPAESYYPPAQAGVTATFPASTTPIATSRNSSRVVGTMM